MHLYTNSFCQKLYKSKIKNLMSLTAVDPVNATLLTSIWDAKASPAVGPNPGTTLVTPSGNPA